MGRKPQLSDFTLREKIGQTCQMQSGFLMNMKDMEAYLKENPIGNVWHTCNTAMTTVNLADIEIDEPQDSTYYREWTKRYAKALNIPPLITNDNPGRAHATDLVDITSVSLLGSADSKELFEEYAEYLSLNSYAIGVNSTWSPNVDTPSYRIGGFRQSSSDPDKLIKQANWTVAAAQKRGIAMCAKHFPGPDKFDYRDSHFVNNMNRMTLDEWFKGQGRVFQEVIDAGVWSIMPGHRSFPNVDNSMIAGNYTPTTLSYKVLTELLKGRMGFKGVVVTDAIEMAALKTAYPDKEDLFVALLNAGNDILLNVKRLDYIDIIEKAVADGRVSMERIDDAAGRVIEMKWKMGLFDAPQSDVVMTEEIRERIRDFNRRASEKALVLQCDRIKQLPLNKDKIKNVAIVCAAHHEPFFKGLSKTKEEFEKRGINATLIRRLESYEQIDKIAEENDLILYATFAGPHAPMGGYGLYAEECGAFYFALHAGKEKSIGVTYGWPYLYYDYCMNMDTFIHAFSGCPESQEAVVKALFGELGFEGEFPYDKPWEDDFKF